MEDNKLSMEAVNASDGIFDVMYSGNKDKGWFVKVKPAFGVKGAGIDHVVFSFVNKGSNGKDFFDIYIGIRKFRGWCIRIQNGSFFTDLEKERERGEKFPVMYKIQTGDKGNKVMGFMLSSTPGMVVVNAKDKTHSYVNIPLDYGFLENMAFDFLEASKDRFHELLLETMERSNSYYANLSEEDEEYASSSDEPAKTPNAAEPSAKESSFVEVESYWAVPNGSVMEKRGKDGNATVLRLVVPALSDNEPNVLANSPTYQLCDCIFYANSLKKAGKAELFAGIMERIKGSKQVKIEALKFKIGDVRDGYRQLIFQC